MTVEIDDRTWNDFAVWAEANGIGPDGMAEYVNRAFRDRFMTDKYGDLNDKFQAPGPKPAEPARESEPVPVRGPEAQESDTAVAPGPEPDGQDAETVQPKPRKKVLKSR